MTRRQFRAVFCAIAAACCFGGNAAAADIAVSGFNEDVVMEAGTSHFARRFDGIYFCWVEQGYKQFSYNKPADGLPASGQFLSASGSGITYHLQP